jgi:hypothetical protein
MVIYEMPKLSDQPALAHSETPKIFFNLPLGRSRKENRIDAHMVHFKNGVLKLLIIRIIFKKPLCYKVIIFLSTNTILNLTKENKMSWKVEHIFAKFFKFWNG